MAVFNNILAGASGATGAAGYEITRSLRFNSADSAYLNRTPSSAGNRKTWTWAGWVKRSGLSRSYDELFGNAGAGSAASTIFFNSDNVLIFQAQSGTYQVVTDQVFRDTSAWYHIVAVADTTNATSTDRLRLYVNGSRISSFSSTAYPTQNFDTFINQSGVAHYLGRMFTNTYFNGYLADIHFIDGQALAPTDFGEYDDNNVWQPIEYSGTYGWFDDSQTWSNGLVSSTGSFFSGQGADKLFDGDTSTSANPSSGSGSSLTFTPPSTLTYASSVEIYTGGAGTHSFNGGSATSHSADTWTTIASGSGTISSIVVTGTNYPAWRAIRVDNKILVNSGVSVADNSFKLNFSDNSSNAALGTDSSGNSNTWTVNNLVAEQPTTLPGVRFGSGNLLTAPSSADFNFGTGDFTVEYYLYRSSLGSNDAAITNYSQVASGYFMCLHSSTTDAYLFLNGSSVASGGTAEANKWIHYAFVRSGTTCTIYKNGVSIASATSSAQAGATNVMNIGAYSDGSSFISGNISNLRIVKGTAVYTGNFTPPTAPLANITNTVLLCCQSSSSATAATVSPGTITATGTPVAQSLSDSTSANDSLIDTPTNYEADSGNNGGNYATLNPLQLSGSNRITLSNGNLQGAGNSIYYGSAISTISVNSGKWYAEFTFTLASAFPLAGIIKTSPLSSTYQNSDDQLLGRTADAYGYRNDQNLFNNNSNTTYGASWTDGDAIGVALDLDAGTLTFYKNGVSQGQAASGLSGYYAIGCSVYGSAVCNANFGQRPFAYTAPTGHLALVTTNLSDPTIADGSTAMDVALYTGTGNSGQTVSGLNFSPDLVWFKSRSAAQNHAVFDTVRGVEKRLHPNLTQAQDDSSTGLTAFNSDGFTFGSNNVNGASSTTYAAWAWDGGTSTVSNTDGSITSSVRANASAGFSIVSYTGDNSQGSTIGTGLNAEPHFVIIKNRDAAESWDIYHKEVGYGKVLRFSTSTPATASDVFPSSHTSSVIKVGSSRSQNGNSEAMIAYCFAPVEGYSAFGSYTGNGSADGPFVYTGFRPRWLMVKSASSGSGWLMVDAARNAYNYVDNYLYANSDGAELSNVSDLFTFTSNGFKVGNSSATNTNTYTYIYAAFAEHPFKTARAR